jgi:hypothetical protein
LLGFLHQQKIRPHFFNQCDEIGKNGTGTMPKIPAYDLQILTF